MKKYFIFGMVSVGMFLLSSITSIAFTQYAGMGGGGNITLEEQLKLAREKITVTQNLPTAVGSSHPTIWDTYLKTNFTIFFSIILAGIAFGCVFLLLLIKSRRKK